MQGRPGGVAVVLLQAQTPAGRAAYTAKPLHLRQAGPCDGPADDQGFRSHGSRTGLLWKRPRLTLADLDRQARSQVRRCGIGMSRSPPEDKPKTPAGRRGASLHYLRTTRVGANPSPVPASSPHEAGRWLFDRTPEPRGCRMLRHVLTDGDAPLPASPHEGGGEESRGCGSIVPGNLA